MAWPVRENIFLPVNSSRLPIRRESAEGLRPSSSAAARAEPRRTVRTNASRARKGGRRRIALTVQKNATRVERGDCWAGESDKWLHLLRVGDEAYPSAASS